MTLCDIGNSSVDILEDEKLSKVTISDFDFANQSKTVYYISVNSALSEKLSTLNNWINLEQYIDRTCYYESMGIDRIVALQSINDGVIVDAGSAITVDVVDYGNFEGGFISAGLKAMRETYVNISPNLDYSFNFELALDKMPKNSPDALTYGFLGLLVKEIARYEKPIILTGGDALVLQPLFKNALVDELLIFKGMKQIITKAKLC